MFSTNLLNSLLPNLLPALPQLPQKAIPSFLPPKARLHNLFQPLLVHRHPRIELVVDFLDLESLGVQVFREGRREEGDGSRDGGSGQRGGEASWVGRSIDQAVGESVV